MRRLSIAVGVLIGLAGCSESNNMTGQGGTGGTASGSAGTTGSAGACQAAGTSGAGGSGGTSGGFTWVAVCGKRGQATATATEYTGGWEEIYMVDDEGQGVDVCVVRFDVTRVGAAPAGCTECSWTQTVQYSNGRVTLDPSGFCANSTLGLTASKIASLNGKATAIGFVREWQGAHGSVRFQYFEDKCMWDVSGTATWENPGSNLFRFTHSDGFCNY
jgi:hypothetical protein